MKRIIPLLLLLSINITAQQNRFQLVEQHKIPDIPSSLYQQSNDLNNYDIHFYHLDLNATNTNTQLSGNVIIEATVVNKLTTFTCELMDYMTVSSIKINNQDATFTHSNNIIIAQCNKEYKPNENIKVQIFYSGNVVGEGYSYGTQLGISASWTLSESIHARDWFPCKQILTDKADSVFIDVTVPNNLTVASNGILKNIVNVNGNTKKYCWETKYPINYYLISMAISEYSQYNIYAEPQSISPEKILIQNFIFSNSGYLNQNKELIDKTKNLVEFFSEKIGIYPFYKEKYGNAMAYFGGGMEHQTMTTLANFGFSLNAHELAHQWFGNYVTCGSWQDIWINEGFASYCEYIALQHFYDQQTADGWMDSAHNYAKEKPNGSVYIPFEELTSENRIFDYHLSYKKGAVIIHTLRGLINNDDLFFEAIRNYLNTYKNNTAIGDDFFTSIGDFTSLDLTNFKNDWYYGKGFPTYEVIWKQEDNKLSITINQTTSSTSKPFFTQPIQIKLNYSDNSKTVVFEPTSTSTTLIFDTNSKINSIEIDPNNYILKGKTAITTDIISELNSETKIIHSPKKNTFELITTDKYLNNNFSINDIKGNIIKRFTIYDKHSEIDISNLKQGLYIISTKNRIIGKIVKL